ncbi:MAG: ABC transporter substrate-binding protein [Chloroflexi bacterium]|nr:ABC transporter substrate-binding protein [Chloroflexota bacterium]
MLGGVGLATAAVIGCEDDDDDADSSASTGGSASTGSAGGGGTPAKTAHLNYGNFSHPPNLDPDSTAATAETFWGVLDTPTRLTPEADVIPHLATEWNFDAGTGEWVYTYRDAEWSDGTPFTANDVKFSYEWYQNPDNQSRLISRVGTVESVRVIDDRTVAIKTLAPDPILPRRDTFVLIKPRHIIEDASKGPTFQAEKPVGTGAYTVTKWVADSQIDLVASPSSWHGNKGFTTVTDWEITENTTRVAALQAGDVDFIADPSIQDSEHIKGFGATMGNPPSDSQQGWDMRYFDGPTADPRVRIAANHAIDVQAQVDVIFLGFSKPMKGQITTEATFGHDPARSPYGFDPDMARQLMKDAGFPNGFDAGMEFRQQTPDQKAFSEATIGDLNSVGIKTDNIPVETNVWRDGLYGQKERATFHWSPWSAFAYEASFAMQWYLKDNAGKFYDNPAFEAAYNAAISEFDDEQRRKNYQSATAATFEDPPAAWVLEAVRLMAWREDKIIYTPRRNPTGTWDEMVPA